MFMEFLENLISGTLPFVFLLICGIYLSFKTNFCQITGFMGSIKLTAKAFLKREKTKEITSYKSACTAISATVGTGNIAGVAGAISIGGAGAVFWMWISAILGMCIKSAEITLQHFNFSIGAVISISHDVFQQFVDLIKSCLLLL